MVKADEILAIVERQTSLAVSEALSAPRTEQNKNKKGKKKKKPGAALAETKEDV